MAVLFALLCIGMCTIYCVLQRRLRKAKIINNEFLEEARAQDTERRKKAAEDEIKLAETQKRVLAYIQTNLIKYPNDERKVWNDKLEEEDCGIC